jgi:hypothetical protein
MPGTNVSSIDAEKRSESIVFYLVNPAAANWRLRHKFWQLWRHENRNSGWPNRDAEPGPHIASNSTNSASASG